MCHLRGYLRVFLRLKLVQCMHSVTRHNGDRSVGVAQAAVQQMERLS